MCIAKSLIKKLMHKNGTIQESCDYGLLSLNHFYINMSHIT